MSRKFVDQQTTRATPERYRLESLKLQVPGLTILSHPDLSRVGETVVLPGLLSKQTVALSRLEPLFVQPGQEGPFRPLDDPYLSRRSLLLRPGSQTGEVRVVRGENRTSIWIRGQSLDSSIVLSAQEVEHGVLLVLSERVALWLHFLDPVPASIPNFGLIGDSPAMFRLRQEIRSAAGLDVPVLLRGETGTGKELVARALHRESQRRNGPFVAINMGSLSASLAASELFGAVRGAYTGADRGKAGFFQSAKGGMLFLDEIGEAPPEIQVMLLRALENRQIQPVGSVETVTIDVRIIAATDAALEAAIQDGRFRAPLLHRLAGFEIRLPPLRQRRDDIARLLIFFLQRDSLELLKQHLDTNREEPWPTPELISLLVEHDWPGNVRQLRNVARRMLIARRDGLSDEALTRQVELMLNEASLTSPPSPEPSVPPSRPKNATPEGYYRRYRKAADVGEDELMETLEKHRWELVPAAEELGVSRPTLYRLIESCSKIRKASELEREEIEEALANFEGQQKKAAGFLKVSQQGLKRRIKQLGMDGSL